MYKISLSKKAIKDLNKLDKHISTKIFQKLKFYESRPNPLSHAQTLQNHKIGQYRFRIGDYRAIFDLDSKGYINILHILRIKHRKEIYQI